MELFYVLASLSAAVVIVLTVRGLRSRDISLAWYEWILGGVGLLMLVLGAQHFVGSSFEGYPFAGMMGLLIFGATSLIILAITWLLVRRHQGAAG